MAWFRERLLVLMLSGLGCLLVLEVALRLVGGAALARVDWLNRAAIETGASMRVACIGESTTMLGASDSYPSHLQRVLNEDALGVAWAVVNLGIAGADTSVILEELPAHLDRYDPHVVVAMMGANDVATEVFGVSDRAHSRAIPDQGVPLAERRGPGNWLRTWRMGELLWFHLTRSGEPHEPEGPRGGPPSGPSADKARGPGPHPPRSKAPRSTGHAAHKAPPPANRAHSAPTLVAFDDDVLRFIGLPERRSDPRGSDDEAEAAFQVALQAGPTPGRALIEYALFLEQKNRHEEALALLARIDHPPWARLSRLLEGRLHATQGRCVQAAPLLEEALKEDPAPGFLLATLGVCYRRAGDEALARDAFRRAVGHKMGIRFLDPGRLGLIEEPEPPFPKDSLPARIARLYHVDGPEDDNLLIRLREDVKPNPQDPEGRIHMMDHLQARGEEEALLSLVTETMGRPDTPAVVLRAMARHMADLQEPELAARLEEMALVIGDRHVTSMTARNYRRLQALLAERGVALVVVQYPTLPPEPLVDLLEWEPGVIFVENRENFEEAIERHGFEEIFWDDCYGSFGHGSSLGNRILAEKVAEGVRQAVSPAAF